MNEPVSHVPVDFPRDFPIHSIMHLVGHFRGQESLSTGELLQHVGCIIGCAGKLLDGSPQPVGAAPENYSDLSDAELADVLESATAPQADAAAAIPPWLMPVLLEVLRRLFKL